MTRVDFPATRDAYPYTGRAGWHPVIANPDNGHLPARPRHGGGRDAVRPGADVGLTRARYVRVRDVSFRGGAPSEGFDLDAAAIVHAETP